MTAAVAACESPIEILLCVALLAIADGDGTFLRLCDQKHVGSRGAIAKGRAGILYSQYTIRINARAARVDFAIAGSRNLIIEADGHDFHERTKEQSAADKKRDRDLTALGWTPIRFTGSEIHRDALECASEVMRLLGLDPVKPSSEVTFMMAQTCSDRPEQARHDVEPPRAPSVAEVEEENAMLIAAVDRARARQAMRVA